MFENKTIARLEQMLDAAMDGTFVESDYDESRLSRLESRWKEFLGSSVLSNQNLETERHRLETFISDISHQTKTPMTIIKMYSELLREEASRDDKASLAKIQSYAEEICRQNARLEFLIDSLTKLSRLENGTLSIVPTEGEIDKLIKTSISSVASKAEQKKITISYEADSSLKASFDMKWTNEALINVLDNAVKYSPEGGNIRITVEQFEVYQAIHVTDDGPGIKEGSNIIFRISDDGPGISEEDATRIFGRFYRGSSVQQEEGVGIGLYLTREIIAKEDGYIKVVPNDKRKGGELVLYLKR